MNTYLAVCPHYQLVAAFEVSWWAEVPGVELLVSKSCCWMLLQGVMAAPASAARGSNNSLTCRLPPDYAIGHTVCVFRGKMSSSLLLSLTMRPCHSSFSCFVSHDSSVFVHECLLEGQQTRLTSKLDIVTKVQLLMEMLQDICDDRNCLWSCPCS